MLFYGTEDGASVGKRDLTGKECLDNGELRLRRGIIPPSFACAETEVFAIMR